MYIFCVEAGTCQVLGEQSTYSPQTGLIQSIELRRGAPSVAFFPELFGLPRIGH